MHILFSSTHLLYMITYLTMLHLEPLHTSGVDHILLIQCNKTDVFSAFHVLPPKG